VQKTRDSSGLKMPESQRWRFGPVCAEDWKRMGSEERLKRLRHELYALHEAMLEAEQQALDTDPAQLAAVRESVKESVEAHYHDPASGWLRELLALITQYDAALASDNISSEDAEDLIEQTRALILPDDAGLPAERHPMEKLSREPRVSTAHDNILELLRSPVS
jgi:hypothetical protein